MAQKLKAPPGPFLIGFICAVGTMNSKLKKS